MIRFSLFGIPISVQWWFFVVTAALGGAFTKLDRPGGLQEVLTWMGVCFVSILWHELGHAAFQRKYGAQPEIMLYGGGGLAIGRGARFTRRQSFTVAAAGPAFGLTLWALSERWFHHFPPRSEFLMDLASDLWQVNFFWSLVNLLPVLPLDGGRMLEAVLGPRPQVLAGIGVAVAAAAALVLFGVFGQLYAAIMFGFFGWQNLQAFRRPLS